MQSVNLQILTPNLSIQKPVSIVHWLLFQCQVLQGLSAVLLADLTLYSPSHNAECSSRESLLSGSRMASLLSGWPIRCSLADSLLTLHLLPLQLTLLWLHLDRRGLEKISRSLSKTKIIPPLPPNSVVYLQQIWTVKVQGWDAKYDAKTLLYVFNGLYLSPTKTPVVNHCKDHVYQTVTLGY